MSDHRTKGLVNRCRAFPIIGGPYDLLVRELDTAMEEGEITEEEKKGLKAVLDFCEFGGSTELYEDELELLQP